MLERFATCRVLLMTAEERSWMTVRGEADACESKAADERIARLCDESFMIKLWNGETLFQRSPICFFPLIALDAFLVH